jgi:hypothetical protein
MENNFKDERIKALKKQLDSYEKITIERIESIAQDIIDDDEWVNDSHSSIEHKGIKDGLNRLIKHLKQI